MFTMTEEQARAYVIAGFFPRRDDTAAITDLQDAYGNLFSQFLDELLDDAETAENAEKLFRLLWSAEEVDRMIESRERRENQVFKRTDLRNVAFRSIDSRKRVIASLDAHGNTGAAENESRRVAHWAEIIHELGIISLSERDRIIDSLM